ncbi:unnamed protein product [Medioppia subpectinata]|uniref:Ig-like domain-containing protein n=1 Tax=Medioppia subpectinata TaxID=1979941 RepID=A0A7R9LJY6_9ACAR|nr:unnamed protein product [Medioppia subpectinata]CAG2119429.1 unnamed protein product [Medioppia subpectinata]
MIGYIVLIICTFGVLPGCLCRSKACAPVKSLTLEPYKRDNDLVLNCDFQFESNQRWQKVYMRYKDHYYYAVDASTLEERYNSDVIDSTRVIDRVPPLYNSTVKYGHIRNVLSDTPPSDDFDCYVTYYDGADYCWQSSRQVPDQRSIKTSIFVNYVLSNQYSVGDDVQIQCDYQLQPNDTFFDSRAIKDDRIFYRYINKDKSFFTPQTGIDAVKVDSKTNQRLWLTINPNDRANANTGGQYKCQVNYVNPDGIDTKIEHIVHLSLV